MTSAAPARAGSVGWVALAALGLLGAGGAAAARHGMLLGAPPAGAFVVLAALVGGLAWLRPPPGVRAAWAGLAWLPLALLLGLPLPGLPALSGPPLYALVLAAVVLALGASPGPVAERAFFPVVLCVSLAGAARVQLQVGAEGDEPHYLMVAESLLRDHDLDLTHDYVPARYGAFYRGDVLEPHYRVRGREDRIYSLHALGLSLLVLPAYALGGYPAASFFMALLSALLARELRLLIRSWGGPDWVAWVVALSPPLVHYSGLVFTEVPAALGVAAGLRLARRGEAGAASWLGLGSILAFLPWLNVRYVPLSLLILAYALACRPRARQAAAALAPLVVSALAIAAFHYVLYGFLDPRRVYGPRPELALRRVPEGLQGLLLDQEFGLLVYAPVLALALPGWLSLLRRGRWGDAAAAGALVGTVLVTAAAWPMWRGGFNPPARFLVPVVPVLGALAGVALRNGPGARSALLAGWGLWLGLSGCVEPRLVHRDRDGSAPLLRAASGAEEWTRLLPRYVLSEPDRHALAWVWGATLAIAILPGRRRAVGAARLAGASLGLLGAAALAGRVSEGRAGGREAVHVVGRPCLTVPGWELGRSCVARWDTGSLGWGPAYEPHRHPDGAVLGSRLELPEGRYRLLVRASGWRPGAAPPALGLEAEAGRQRSLRPSGALAPSPEGLEGAFDVRRGEQRTTLLLRGGVGFVVEGIQLALQPSGS